VFTRNRDSRSTPNEARRAHHAGTTLDANVLVKKLRNADGLRFGNNVYTVEFASKHHDKCFPKSRPFGIEYTFTLKDAVEGVPVRPLPPPRSCVCSPSGTRRSDSVQTRRGLTALDVTCDGDVRQEYLVDLQEGGKLRTMAEEEGLQLVYRGPFHDFAKLMTTDQDASELARQSKVFPPFTKDDFTPDEWDTAHLYYVFAFQKVRLYNHTASALSLSIVQPPRDRDLTTGAV